MMCFKMRKLKDYNFHLHLETNYDNVEICVVLVNLLILNYSNLEDHT